MHVLARLSRYRRRQGCDGQRARADGRFHVSQQLQIFGGSARKGFDIQVDAIRACLDETAHMIRKRLALALVLQVYVPVQESASPWHNADFGGDSVHLGKKPGRAFRIVANKARLRPPAGPALAIHRPQKGVDALDTVRP